VRKAKAEYQSLKWHKGKEFARNRLSCRHIAEAVKAKDVELTQKLLEILDNDNE